MHTSTAFVRFDSQRDLRTVVKDSLALQFSGGDKVSIPSKVLPNFLHYPCDRHGMTLDLWLDSHGLDSSAMHADADGWQPLFMSSGNGSSLFDVLLAKNGTAKVHLQDQNGRSAAWYTDPVCSARLQTEGQHYLALMVDAGPKMILWVVDGHLCDGGPYGSAWSHASPVIEGFKAGWSIFDPNLADIGSNGSSATVGTAVKSGRLYSRTLYVSECIGNWRAGALGEEAETISI